MAQVADQQPKIVDFEGVLDDLLLDENHIWGKKNKPRAEEPSMFELMKWNEDEANLHDFKSNNRSLLKSSEVAKFKHRINRAGLSAWKTESQDAFRKFVYSPEKKKPIMQETTEGPLPPKSQPRHFQAVVTNDGEIIPEEVYVQNLDKKFTSDYLDKYSLKNITNLDELQREIRENTAKESKDKNFLSGFHSESKRGRKMVCKQVQFRPFAYDRSGELIGKEEEYFKDVWLEVEDEEKPQEDHKAKVGSESPIKKARTLEGERYEEDAKKADEEADFEIKRTDYSGVKSRLLSAKKIKKAKILDPESDHEKLQRRKERIKKFGEQTKWLPNSAFTTYYGKPAFENYGSANVRPASGGVIYGNYMKTHNVNPHRSAKNPQFKQTYNNALMYGSRNPACEPELPRKVKEDYRLSQEQVEALKNRNRLFPDENLKEVFENQKIMKPDLINSLRFASEENTPTQSPLIRGMGKKSLATLQKEQKAIRKKLASKSAKKSKSKGKTLVSRSLEKKLLKTSAAPKNSKIQESSARPFQVSEIVTSGAQLQKSEIVKSEVPNERPAKTPEIPKEKSQKVLESQKEKQQKTALKRISQKPARDENEESEEDIVYPEHEEKLKRQFIKSMKAKKEAANRLAPKVTEVYPIVQTKKESVQEKKDKETETKEVAIDAMKPPKGYISNLSASELNPKFYKHIPANWLKRIPYAGKVVEKSDDIRLCIHPEED